MTGTAELNDELSEVGLGDKRIDIQTFDRYKGRLNVTDRLAIISPTLSRVKKHYYELKKKSFKCLTTPQKRGVCCEHLGDPDQAFGMVLFQYMTNEDGSLLTTEKLSGRIKLWIVSETRYAELSSIHKEWPLLAPKFEDPQVDLLIKCSEEKFQRMAFTPTREAFWKKKKEWHVALLQKMDKAKQKLVRAMASEMTDVEVMALLQVDVGRSPTLGVDASDGIDVAGVLDVD